MVQCHEGLDELFTFLDFTAPSIEPSLEKIKLNLVARPFEQIVPQVGLTKDFLEQLGLWGVRHPLALEVSQEGPSTLEFLDSTLLQLMSVNTDQGFGHQPVGSALNSRVLFIPLYRSFHHVLPPLLNHKP